MRQNKRQRAHLDGFAAHAAPDRTAVDDLQAGPRRVTAVAEALAATGRAGCAGE